MSQRSINPLFNSLIDASKPQEFNISTSSFVVCLSKKNGNKILRNKFLSKLIGQHFYTYGERISGEIFKFEEKMRGKKRDILNFISTFNIFFVTGKYKNRNQFKYIDNFVQLLPCLFTRSLTR